MIFADLPTLAISKIGVQGISEKGDWDSSSLG